MDDLKKYWQHLTMREQSLLLGGTIVLALLILFFMIWSPLRNHISSLRQQVQQDQELLIWMKQKVPLLESLQKNNVVHANTVAEAITTTLKNNNLSSYATDVISENGKSTITFKQVPFDLWVKWLDSLQASYQITLDQLEIAKLTDLGMVKVTVALKSA